MKSELTKLSVGNIPKYLQGLGVFEGVNWKSVDVKEITKHTNVNFVYKVSLCSEKYKIIYIKQAFGFVKVAPDFPAPLDRQHYEKKSIVYLQKYWNGRIPEIIHYDNKNNVLLLTDVGEGWLLVAEEIAKSHLHFEIAKDLGRMMAQLHYPTYGKTGNPVRGKKDSRVHINFIFNFRLRGARERYPYEANKLFRGSQKQKTSMTYGDWATKNVLVRDKKIRVVDFENVVRFDPAFDIGYALAHWVLEVDSHNNELVIKFLKDFEKSYKSIWKTRKSDVGVILQRSARYAGAMMFHRFAGVKNTNRVDKYLQNEKLLTTIAKQFLFSRSKKPSECLASIKLTQT